MSFAGNEMLFLIWTLPVFLLLFIFGFKKRRRILSGYVSPKGLNAIVSGILPGRRRLKAALVLSSLFFIILALSGPQYGYKWQEIERKGIDIIVALDCSRSMLATDIKPTRLDRAKREVYDLLSLLEGDRIGLVAFAGTAFLQAPLTLDYEGFHIFLDALSPDFLPVGGTDITGAISTSLSGFDAKANSEKAIIIITDGERTGGDKPMVAAEQAEKAGVKIFCVGVGGKEGIPVPDEQGGFKKDNKGKIVLTKLDEDTLKVLSARTGGTYVRSIAGDMDLDIIYTRDIRGKMTRSTLSSGRKKIWEDRYQWLLALALIAFVLESLLPAVKKTIPTVLLVFLLFSYPAQAASYRDNMQKGLNAYEEGDYQAALKHFTDAQLENPEEAEVSYNLGNAYYKLGDYDAAIHNFQEALKSPDESLRQKTYYNLGNTHFRKQTLDESLKQYQEALQIDSNDMQTRQNIEYVEKIKAQQKQQQQKQPGDQENQDSPKEGEDKKGTDSRSGEDKQKDGEGKEPQSDKQEKQDPEDPRENTPESSYGKEMDADQQQKSDRDEPSRTDTDEEEARESESMGQQARSGQDAEQAERKKQAERALNRLKDQPGRATIPLYRKRDVERDW